MFQKVKQSQVVWNSMSVFIKHSVSLEESSAEWNNLHFEARDRKWALIKDWVFAEAIHIFTGDLQSQEISSLSYWQIFESYSVNFHIWKRPDPDVTISEFVCFCPSYMFLLQFWSVPLESTKIGIGSRAPQSVNPVFYLFLTKLLFIVMELSNHSIGITTIQPASTSDSVCRYHPRGILPSQHLITHNPFLTFRLELSTMNCFLLGPTRQSLISERNKSYLFKHSCFLLSVYL